MKMCKCTDISEATQNRIMLNLAGRM